MRILRLQLSNLNSLRGVVAVDFTVAPFVNSGLFAITGPTGAGKTTLLDAITLALYGRAARYGKAPSPEAMMSRHTGECSAEVEFTCASGTFRAVWQLQRARKRPTGNLQPAKRRIIVLPDETVLVEQVAAADAKIVELTGLDYDRFLRSVLLAQGEFAAFLRAEPKERTELLQQVTGTAIYQEISRATHQRAAQAERAHADLVREHQAVSVLDPERRAALEASLTQHERRRGELTALLPALVGRVTAAERWREIEAAAHQHALAQAAWTEARDRAAPLLTRLEQHEKAAPAIADLATLDQLDGELRRDAARQRELTTALPDHEAAVRGAGDALRAADQAVTEAETHHAQQRTLWAEVTEIDRTLATAREALRHATAHHSVTVKTAEDVAKTIAVEQGAMEKLSAQHRAAAEWLAQHAADAAIMERLPALEAAAARWSGGVQRVTTMQQTLAKHRADCDRLTQVANTCAERIPPLEAGVQARHNAVLAAARALADASEQLPLPDLEARRSAAREQCAALEHLASDAARLRGLDADLAALRRRADENAAAITTVTTTRAHLTQRLADATRLLETQRNALDLAKRVQSLESQRAELHDGQPCPLCGATHHPYAGGDARLADEVVAARQRIEASMPALASLQREANEAEKQHTLRTADQARLAAELARCNLEREAALQRWRTAAAAATVDIPWTDEPALAAALAQAREREVHRDAQMAAVHAAGQALETAKEAQRQAQAGLDQARADFARDRALADQLRSQVPALEGDLAAAEHEATGARAAFLQALGELAPPPAAPTAAPTTLAALKSRAQAWQAKLAEAQRLETELRAADARLETLRQRAGQAAAELTTAAGSLSAAQAEEHRMTGVRREKFGDRVVADAQRDADASLQQVRESREAARTTAGRVGQELATTRAELARLTTTIAGRTQARSTLAARIQLNATAAGLAGEPALRAALLPPDEATAAAGQRRQLEERRVALATEAQALETQRAGLPAAARDDAATVATLRAELAARETERSAVEQEMGAARATLAHDVQQRARQSAFAVRIAGAHRDYVRWDRLKQLIGSADGSLFARFAQGLTLERLTLLANQHLAHLNPRYSVRRASAAEAEDLELEIIDHDQADVARPMRSLSGGESFLVSLALALGLSELASGRTAIESLFIDEGFGSLDAVTLDTAMDALENLQARGKTIGVISHVAAMQERIAAQIRVEKESNGCSRVAIVG